MDTTEAFRKSLSAAIVGGASPLAAADRLCEICVELLDVDGAAISLILTGATHGTYGSSGSRSRLLDEFQFTLGEGPCLEAVSGSQAVLVPDFEDPREQRWPAYAGAVLESGVRAVFALPVGVGSTPVGALDLFRDVPGPLSGVELAGGLLAAEFAAMPLLDMLTEGRDHGSGMFGDLGQTVSLARVEVYQATGMLMGQLNVGPDEALTRLRAHAFAEGLTASEVAWAIVDRRLSLDSDVSDDGPGGGLGRRL